MLRAFGFIVLTFAACQSAVAANVTVGSGPLCNHSTIESAVTAADAGDLISIESKLWSVSPMIVLKDLTLVGGLDASCQTLTTNPATLSSSAGARIFTILAGSVVFERLELQGADLEAAPGGAIYVSGADTSLEIYESEIRNNKAVSGGAIYLTSSAQVSIFDSFVDLNSAKKNDSPGGGAIHCDGADLDVVASSFSSNSTTGDGGALLAEGCSVTINGSEFLQSLFRSNSADQGGAVFLDTSFSTIGKDVTSLRAEASAPKLGVLFESNQATTSGGAIAAIRVSIVNPGYIQMEDNSAGISGGGIYLNASELSNPDDCHAGEACAFLGFNTAPSGAAIHATGATVRIQRYRVKRASSSATQGAFLWSSSSDVTIGNSSYQGGSQGLDSGTVLDDRDSIGFTVVSSTFVDSSALDPVILLNGTGDVSFQRSLFWNNDGPIYSGAGVSAAGNSLFDCNLVQSTASLPVGHIDSTVADPLFTDLFDHASGLYPDAEIFPGPTSPAIDLCLTPGLEPKVDAVDITGYVRSDGIRDAGALESRYLTSSRYETSDLTEWSTASP